MAGYKKLSDTWRNETAPETFAGFATFAGGQGQIAKFDLPDTAPQKLDRGAAKAAKAAKADAVILQKVTPAPAKTAKAAKVGAEPSLAYRATSVGPDGVGCKVEIVELPQAGRYQKVFGILQLRPPALVPIERWRQCVRDGSRFLAKWGSQAEALGWTSADLFGLHTPPAKPHPSYRRLSRYDATGLIWLLEGREVVALTAETAAIENPATGSITVYRKHNKPALEAARRGPDAALNPPGDDIFDITPRWQQ